MNKSIKATKCISIILTFFLLSSCGGGGSSSSEGGSDTTPPVINSVDPASGATGIALSTTVRAQFSEDMNNTTVNGTTFTLKDAGGNPVSGTVGYANRVAQFTPTSALQALVVYTATITVGVTDAAGNALGAEKTWSFTTVADGTIPAPALDPIGGTYATSQNVTISCTDGSATIMYTVDGSDPSSSHGSTYSTGFPVAVNTTVKAMAYRDGYNDSSVTEAAYVIKAATPGFSPAAGTHGTNISVSLSTTTTGADIYYTMTTGTVSSPPADPENPTVLDSHYSSAIQVNDHNKVVKIKAIAVKSGMGNSDILSGTFTIDYSISPAKWGSAIWGIHKWGP